MNPSTEFKKFSMDLTKLSQEQLYSFEKFKKGENIFVTGPGGTGKTKLIQYFVSYAESINKNCQVCALTGCAALLLNCGARTIHSWSGIKLAKGDKENTISNVLSNRNVLKSWSKVDILIIDEVSMMSKKIFEILEEIARLSRRNSSPFGGIQVVFTGDFFQLPPVSTFNDVDTELFCFESPVWNKVFLLQNHIELKTMFRQTDPLYIQILLEIRRGSISEENKKILQNYVKREYKSEDNAGIIPTKLFAVRNKVDYVNNAMFEKIKETPYNFDYEIKTDLISYIDSGKLFNSEISEKCRNMTLREKEREVEQIASTMPCAKNIILKKGAVVMCTYNIDVENGICNGSQGIITDIIDKAGKKIPVVKFYNGRVINMELHYWQSDDYPCIAIGQIPLCLAWALTIHKIQGTTMAMAEMDIGMSIFEYGQIYVALSRIQSLSGLYLLSFNPNKIKANQRVINFYNRIPAIEINKLLKESMSSKETVQEKVSIPSCELVVEPIHEDTSEKKVDTISSSKTIMIQGTEMYTSPPYTESGDPIPNVPCRIADGTQVFLKVRKL